MEEMEGTIHDDGISLDTVALEKAVTKLRHSREELWRSCSDLFANANRFDLSSDTVDALNKADKELKHALKAYREASREMEVAFHKLAYPPLSMDGNPGPKTAEQAKFFQKRKALCQAARNRLEKALFEAQLRSSITVSRYGQFCYETVDQSSMQELSRMHSQEHRALIEYFTAVDDLAILVGVSREKIAEEQSRKIGNTLTLLFAIIAGSYALYFAIYELPRYLS